MNKLSYVDNGEYYIKVCGLGRFKVFIDTYDGREYICVENTIIYLEDMEEI